MGALRVTTTSMLAYQQRRGRGARTTRCNTGTYPSPDSPPHTPPIKRVARSAPRRFVSPLCFSCLPTPQSLRSKRPSPRRSIQMNHTVPRHTNRLARSLGPAKYFAGPSERERCPQQEAVPQPLCINQHRALAWSLTPRHPRHPRGTPPSQSPHP